MNTKLYKSILPYLYSKWVFNTMQTLTSKKVIPHKNVQQVTQLAAWEHNVNTVIIVNNHINGIQFKKLVCQVVQVHKPWWDDRLACTEWRM